MERQTGEQWIEKEVFQTVLIDLKCKSLISYTREVQKQSLPDVLKLNDRSEKFYKIKEKTCDNPCFP